MGKQRAFTCTAHPWAPTTRHTETCGSTARTNKGRRRPQITHWDYFKPQTPPVFSGFWYWQTHRYWRSCYQIYIDFYQPSVSALGRGDKWTAKMENPVKEKKVVKRGIGTTQKAPRGDQEADAPRKRAYNSPCQCWALKMLSVWQQHPHVIGDSCSGCSTLQESLRCLFNQLKKKKARVFARQLTGLVLSAGPLSQQNLSCLKFPNTTRCCSLAPLHHVDLPLPSPSSPPPTRGHRLHHPQMLTFTTPSLKYSSLTHSEATSLSVPTVSTVRLPDRAFCTHVSADN